MQISLVIEKSSAADNNIKSVYNSFKGESKENLSNRFTSYLPQLKCGYGGNHIWISNEQNERLAIVYYRDFKEVKDNSKKHNATLVATFDKDARHILITHKRKHDVSATYDCAMATGELDGNEQHVLTIIELAWLSSINNWIEDCYQSLS